MYQLWIIDFYFHFLNKITLQDSKDSNSRLKSKSKSFYMIIMVHRKRFKNKYIIQNFIILVPSQYLLHDQINSIYIIYRKMKLNLFMRLKKQKKLSKKYQIYIYISIYILDNILYLLIYHSANFCTFKFSINILYFL